MLSCDIFSIARIGVLQYIHPEGFSYPQLILDLEENIFGQLYNFRYSHFMVKPWFNHELAMV